MTGTNFKTVQNGACASADLALLGGWGEDRTDARVLNRLDSNTIIISIWHFFYDFRYRIVILILWYFT